LVVVLLGAAPGVANAALGVSSGVLAYNARVGEVNDVHIAFDQAANVYSVGDVVAIDADPTAGCTTTGNAATCSGDGVTSIRVNASDMDDGITVDASVSISTQLFGRDGNDVLNGGSGNDLLNGGNGDDTMIGNGGTDTADFSSGPAGQGVSVDLPAGTATGVGSDAIDPSAENARGTAFDDTIISRNGVKNAVSCLGGTDTVTSDRIDAVAPDCEVNDNAPDTRFDSLPPDPVDTSTPSFSFSSNDPEATFICRFDTGDAFTCTSPLIPEPPLRNGEHTFEVYATDIAGKVDQTPAIFTFTVNAPGPPPPLPPGGTTLQKGGPNVIVGSLVLISGRSVKLVRRKLVPVSLTCAGQHRCEGDVTVSTDKPVRMAQTRARPAKKRKKSKPRVVKLGSTHYSIEGNRRVRVMVPLSRSKVRLLKRLKRVKVRATIRETDLKGHPRISTRTFTLRAR
jgi:hypothetical protein